MNHENENFDDSRSDDVSRPENNNFHKSLQLSKEKKEVLTMISHC